MGAISTNDARFERRADAAATTAEAARCAALIRYEVLDTPPERAFDRIVRLVARVLDVPIAAISLIDSRRQWFKARYGLVAEETPLDAAFCHTTIRSGGMLVVPDAVADPRFSNNALVTGPPNIRFYAGAPLVTPDGFAVGALCAIDRVPRALNPTQLAFLDGLADLVVHELEVRSALGELYREVGEGRRAARTMKCEGARLEALLNATGNAVVTAGPDGQVASMNHAAETLFGLGPGEALRWPVARLMTNGPGTADPALAARPSDGVGFHRDGHAFPIELSHVAWTDAEDRTLSGVILRDISDRQRAMIERSQRDASERAQENLTALGRVAGGVAHEINNLLQPVIGLTELEMDNLASPMTETQSETLENLTMVLDCGRQMREIVKKILIFARKGSPDLSPIEFAPALQRTIIFIGHLVPSGTRIALTADAESAGHAVIHEVGMIEVMTNLALNAAHAMDNSGTVAVHLSRIILPPEAASLLGMAAGPCFRVTVADTGHGMDSATRARLFEPFFTTKGVGKGTGLGLAMTYGTLRNWQGAIEVDSTPGQGSTFTLTIPVAIL